MTGIPEMQELFSSIGDGLIDIVDGDVGDEIRRVAMDEFAGGFYHDVTEAFALGRDPTTGVAWAPVLNRPGRPLYQSGNLFAAALAAISVGRIQGSEQTGDMVFRMVSPVYWRVHNEGNGRIKRRHYFGFSEGTIAATQKVAAREVTRAVAEAIAKAEQDAEA